MGVVEILKILGALGLFIYGMKIMSDGIQKAAGKELRKILRSITTNRFVGLFTGFFTTAIVQSSSATTVMTVSFVNAGLISLVDSAGVIIGANIGTTITGWLVSILGFKVKLASISLPLILIGVPLFLSQRDKFKFWGEFIIGFSLLFMGLNFMQISLPDIGNNPGVLKWLGDFTQYGFLSNLIFVLVGIVLTIILQSSSALVALVLTMCLNGWIPFNLAAASILGANIGTTITAEVASLVANVHAKRSARIHTLFNVFGVVWMIIILPLYLEFLSTVVQKIFFVGNPYTDNEALPIALSAFHSSFNIINGILFLSLLPFLVNIAKKTVSSGEHEEEIFKLKYIQSTLPTPELSFLEAQKELQKYAEITSRMLGFSKKLIFDIDEKVKLKMIKRIRKYEKISDRFDRELNDYLISIASEQISSSLLFKVKSMLNACYELERVGDLFNQLGKIMAQKIDNKIWFSPKQREELKSLIEYIEQSFKQLDLNLSERQYEKMDMNATREIRLGIKDLTSEIKSENGEYDKLDDETNMQSLIIFNNLTNAFAEIGELIYRVSRSLYPGDLVKSK